MQVRRGIQNRWFRKSGGKLKYKLSRRGRRYLDKRYNTFWQGCFPIKTGYKYDGEDTYRFVDASTFGTKKRDLERTGLKYWTKNRLRQATGVVIGVKL